MKIAIASCSNPNNYPNQPVWSHISAKKPDALVLLGDTIYLDVPWATTFNGEMIHPSDADAADFLKHGLRLYRAQLGQSGFAALIKNVAKTYAIWDDHDFLWNNAAGDALPKNVYRDHFQATRALFKAFREAIGAKDPSIFPALDTDPRLHNPAEPAPGYQAVDLDANLCLHLTDGRSFRNKYQMLGSAQRAQITNAMQARPGFVHVMASGNVFNGTKGERWSAYPEDFEWLKLMAKQHRILIASGDVHENRIPTAFKVPGGHDILEITSSGAAIGSLVAAGKQKHNFGMIEISNGQLTLSTFKDDPVANDVGRVSIQINGW